MMPQSWRTLWKKTARHIRYWIFSKSICNHVLVSRALVNFISEVIPQTEMLHMCSEDPLSTDREYNMQLLETSSVHWDEIVDNHRGDLGQDEITRWELRTSGRLFDKIFTSNFRNSPQKKLQLPSLSDLLFFLPMSKIVYFISTQKC